MPFNEIQCIQNYQFNNLIKIFVIIFAEREMSLPAYIFLPDIHSNNESATKQEIAKVFNERFPQGSFDSSKIIVSRKDRKQNKYNIYLQTKEQFQEKLLALKEIKLTSQTVNIKKCFPYHQIYINKLPDSINKQTVQNYFQKFGKVTSVQLLPAQGSYQNIKQKSNINHCYIRYQSNQSAQKCLFFEDKHSITNKDDLRVVRAYKIGQNDETDKKLFLKITPIVQFESNKIETKLYEYFSKFGELREKIRVQQQGNLASKACVTYTSCQAGDKALQNFTLNKIQPNYTLILRNWASKQSPMMFISGLLQSTTQEKLKLALQKYGKVVNCTLNPSKKPGVINAIVSFSQEQGLKSALAQYNLDKDLLSLFAGKPYMDMHMNANLRNQYKNYNKKDKKPMENPLMNMGGIGQGYSIPPRMPLLQPLGGFNQNMNLGMGNPNFGMNMMNPLGNNPRMNQPPQNFKPL